MLKVFTIFTKIEKDSVELFLQAFACFLKYESHKEITFLLSQLHSVKGSLNEPTLNMVLKATNTLLERDRGCNQFC